MKKGRFTEEQIIGILKEHEAGRKVPELAREIGVSTATICSQPFCIMTATKSFVCAPARSNSRSMRQAY